MELHQNIINNLKTKKHHEKTNEKKRIKRRFKEGINEFSTRHNMKELPTFEAFGNTIRMMVDKRITLKQLNAPAL